MNPSAMPARRTPRHAALVLAAGASTRLGSPKQLLILDDETLLHRAARLALGTAPHECWIVLGAHADEMQLAVRDLPVRSVHCDDWRTGMGATLATGIAALSADIDAALIVLCDQPALDAKHLSALLDAWRANPVSASASTYAGKLGVPAVLPRAWFDTLRAARTDQGARQLLRAHAASVTCIENAALELDIDSSEDLARLGRTPLR